MGAESEAAPAGDRGCGAAELGRSWSCSRIANGCRSRQAACGPSRPRAKSAWITSRGLASRRESAARVKERRKPVRRGKAASTVAGSPLSESESVKAPTGTLDWKACKRSPTEHLSMEGVSDRTSRSLDERAGEAILVSAARGQPRIGGTTGDVRGHSRSAIGEENAPLGRPPARAARRLDARKGDGATHRVARSRSWSCAVKRQANRGRIAARWSGATQENRSSSGARVRESALASRPDLREELARSTRRKPRAR